MLFVSQFAVFQFSAVKAFPIQPLRIYQDAEGNYYFKTLSNDTVYLTPFVRLQRWECFSDLNTSTLFQKLRQLISRFVNCEIFYNETENKLYIKCKLFGSVIVEIILYPLNITEYGALEWEIKVYRKEVFTVLGNNLTFPFFLKDLKAYYQPALFQEYGFSKPFSNSTFSVNATHVMRLINGTWMIEAYRPENVVGSYAIYHAYKMNNEYKTGKAFHIYRPKIIDAEGNEAWCNLNITNRLLKIEISKDFLDNAVYPVTIDPTFGYETAGATSQEVAKDYRGSWFTCPEDGTANSLTVYIRQDTSGGSVNVKTAIYDKSDDSLVRSSEEIAITSTDYYWETFNLLTPNPDLTANKDYWLVVWGDVGNGLEFPYIKYDSATSKGADETSTDYTDGEGDSLWENPWTGYSVVDKKYSIYCTYTAGEGAQEYSHTFTETLKPSATLNLWQAQTYTLTQTIVTTSTLDYGAESIYTFTQTIKPSETVTYMQEQKYILTETAAPSTIFKHWIEGITIFTETFTETIKPKTNMHYSKELIYTLPETINPQTTFNYATELAETFITIIETLKPKTTMTPILPSAPLEEINWGIIALGFAMLAFVLATTALTTKRD